jgi:N-acetylglucosaminyldiphosphoundecaprenol N-acetyl-beta-D-mannosaminyltransferase
MQKIQILGVSFDNVTMKEAVSLAFSYIENGTQAAVVTPNAEILQLCLESEDVKRSVCAAEIVLPDGEGALWAAKKLGSPLKQKVAGVEFGMELAKKAAENGKSIFLLGGKEGVAQKAGEELLIKFPTLKIVGSESGYFDKTGEENARIIDLINKSGADILYVCLGAPMQEKWIFDNRSILTSPKLMVCLGGSLDIYSGEAKRAPEIFIKMRIEWLWRFLRQPSRIGRMMKLPKFMISVNKYKRKYKSK